MKQQAKKPGVRFPSFEDDWPTKDGELLFTSVSNKNHNSDLPILAITQEQGAIPRHLIDYNISVTDKSIETYKVVDVGDFIISLRSFQGGIEFSSYRGICSPAYIVLKPIAEIDRTFFKYYFKTPRYIKQLTKNLEGIRDGKMISFKYFSEAKLTFPTIPEQKRIAAFFTVLDKKIAELKQKKALLEQYKKGVMQKLFSQELRFKDDNGKEFPKWEKKKLGEVAESIQSGKDKPETKGEYILYGSIGAIGVCSKYSYNGKFILIARVGANAGTINMVRGEFSVSDNTLVFVGKKEINIDFSYYLLTSQNINKLVFGSGQPLITSGILKSLNIQLPSLSEQTKIANFLNAIDDKINRTENQIQQTEQYKKGLLQKMFC